MMPHLHREPTLGLDGIEAARQIIQQREPGLVAGIRLDLTAAQALVGVYDALTDDGRRRLTTLPAMRAATIALACAARAA